MKISELTLNDNNPRQIRAENLKRLVRDIKADPGFLEKRSVLYYTDPDTGKNIVYAGNMRIRAAKQAGMTDIPAVQDTEMVKDGKLDQALLTRRIFEDNESYGEYDTDLLANNFDPHYCDVIVQRYVDFTGNTKIKRNGEVIEWQQTKKN